MKKRDKFQVINSSYNDESYTTRPSHVVNIPNTYNCQGQADCTALNEVYAGFEKAGFMNMGPYVCVYMEQEGQTLPDNTKAAADMNALCLACKYRTNQK